MIAPRGFSDVDRLARAARQARRRLERFRLRSRIEMHFWSVLIGLVIGAFVGGFIAHLLFVP